MRTLLTKISIIFALVLLIFPAQSQANNVQAQLVSEQASIQPGSSFDVGLLFELKPHCKFRLRRFWCLNTVQIRSFKSRYF